MSASPRKPNETMSTRCAQIVRDASGGMASSRVIPASSETSTGW